MLMQSILVSVTITTLIPNETSLMHLRVFEKLNCAENYLEVTQKI